MQWYYAIDDQRLGPVSHAEFERLMQSGKITGGALVWRKGMDQWKTLDEVKERDPALFAEVPPPLPSAEVHAEVVDPEAGDDVRRAPRLEPEGGKPKAPEVLHYAGFWRRLGAHLVDLLAWWIVWQLFSGIVGSIYFPEAVAIAQKGTGHQATPDELMVMLRFFGVALVIGAIWAVIYDAVFMLRLGATPGKLLFGLRVVKANGQPLGFSNVAARCLAKGLVGIPTLCIGYLIVAFDDQKRGLHDHISQTRVIIRKREL